MMLKGKVAIVTGGAIRIGRGLSLALAEAGCNLFIHYGRSEEEAQKTKLDVEAHGVKAAIYSADLTDVEQTQSILPTAVDWFGQVDILINSAAIFQAGDLFTTDLDSWDKQFSINLRAPFLLSQAFAAQILPNNRGSIININDARIFKPGADHFAYRLTKSALLTMTESLAHDLAPNINVNAVALGAMLPPPEQDEEYLQNLAQTQIPLRRAGNSKMVGESVLHLLSQDFITGATLRIDGGEFL